MENNNYSAIAKLIGVSEESISSLPEEIRTGMKSVFETVEIRDERDKKIMYQALDNLWQKGSVIIGLHEVSKAVGIAYDALSKIDYEAQQEIVYEYMMDSSQTERLYSLINKAIAVSDLDKVARLLFISLNELKRLPDAVKEKMCKIYTMEFDEDGNNNQLIAELRDMII